MKMSHLLCLLAVLVLAGQAHAGKLADGFRGHPFGDAAFLEEPPDDNCMSNPETGVRWTCQTSIGDVPVSVSYMVLEGLYIGVLITTEGYTHASNLLTTLQQAYGPGRKKHDWDTDSMGDRLWMDGNVFGVWEWNKYSGEGKITLMANDVYLRSQELQKSRTSTGVNDL